MYFYAQRWSDAAVTWIVEGDQYSSAEEAEEQLDTLRAAHPEQDKDDFRITAYLTPLTQDNESQRIAR